MENSYSKNLLENKRSLNKVSFRSIIAGVIIAIILQLLLSLLGAGIGLVSFTPTTDDNPFSGFGIGTIIWIIVSTIISLFAGGWVSGWLATSTNKIDRLLHGLLTWAVYTLLSLFLVTSSIGSILGGIGGMISSTFNSNQKTVYIKNENNKSNENGNDNLLNISPKNLESLKNEALTLLKQTEKSDLQPENLANKGEKIVNEAKEGLENSAENPENFDTEVDGVISKIFSNTEDVLSDFDKEALVNVVSNRTNKTKAEAEQIVDNWINSAKGLKGDSQNVATNLKEEVKDIAENVKEEAKVVSEDVTDSVGKFAIYLFLALVVGAISAVLGSLFTKNKVAYEDGLK